MLVCNVFRLHIYAGTHQVIKGNKNKEKYCLNCYLNSVENANIRNGKYNFF